MLKVIMAAFIATVCWMTTANATPTDIRTSDLKAIDVKLQNVVSVTLDCSSRGSGDYVECETGYDFTKVEVLSEYRPGTCTFGSTWGTYGRSIWVNHGCSARFEVTIDGDVQPPPVPNPVPAPIQSVDCRWNNVNWQPFYRVMNRWIGRPGFGFQDANTCTQAVQMSRRNAVCNWVGNGFTPYDIETNREVIFAAYPDLASCYSAL